MSSLVSADTPSAALSPSISSAAAPRRPAKRARESSQTYSREQLDTVVKRATAARVYTERLARKREGEDCFSIAREIASEVGTSERSVRRWAHEIDVRGDALRKPGSGRPVKYDDAVLDTIREANDMYEGSASGRDVVAEEIEDDDVENVAE